MGRTHPYHGWVPDLWSAQETLVADNSSLFRLAPSPAHLPDFDGTLQYRAVALSFSCRVVPVALGSNSQSRVRADWAAVLALLAITTVSLAYFGHLYKNEPYHDRVRLKRLTIWRASMTAILENIDDEQIAAIGESFERQGGGCRAIEREFRERVQSWGLD